MMPVVWIRSGYPPYPRIARARAYDVHRAFTLLSPATATFSVSRTDAGLDSDVMSSGNVVEIIGDTAMSWYGVLKPYAESLNDGDERWTAEDFLAQLSERNVPALSYDGYASGRIVEDLFNYADRSSPMNFDMAPTITIEKGPSLSIDISAGSLADAINTVVDATNYEYGLVNARSTPSYLDILLAWRNRLGEDKRGAVVITNAHVAAGEYSIDPKGTPASVRVFGAGARLKSDRTAFVGPTPVTNAYPISPVPLSPVYYKPGGNTGITIYDLNMLDQSSVDARATREMKAPRYGRERVELTLNTRFEWSSIQVGDTVTLRLGNVRHGDGAVRWLRIVGMQPDEAAGEMDIVGEVADDYAA